MTKLRKPGSVQEVCQVGYAQSGGLERVAVLIRRSVKWLIMSTDPDVEDRRLTLEEAAALTAAGNGNVLAFAEYLAALAGYTLTPMATREACPVDLLRNNAGVLKEVAEAGQAVALALADGQVSDAEKAELSQHYREVEDSARSARLALGGG